MVLLPMSDEHREEKELDLTSPQVVTKYKTTAEIVDSNVYKNVKRKIETAVGFPSCVAVNNTVCHVSPLANDESILEEGDLGCHVDGFIAVVAHTHVVHAGPVTGRAADVIAAANTAAEVALRLVMSSKKPTKTIEDPEIKTWLALGTKTKKKGGGKKKKEIGLIYTSVPCSTSKKDDKVDESVEAEPMDAANGATSQD